MELEQITRQLKADLNYYQGQLNNHKNMNARKFSPEQKDIYMKNIQKFSYKVELLTSILKLLEGE